MSSSESLSRSHGLEHPVTVILVDRKESFEDNLETLDKNRFVEKKQSRDNRTWSVTSKRLTHEDDVQNEETIQISILDTSGNDRDDNSSRFSSDRSTASDITLVKVNVIVDDDDRGHHDDNDEVTSEESELFHSSDNRLFLGSSSEVFEDNNLTNIEVQGQVTKREMEIVEHETTRKYVILAPNTKLDSDEEDGKLKDITMVPLLSSDRSAYDEAAALYQSSIRGHGSMLPVVVFKVDSETQTNRNRTTQTGVDQSTQTVEKAAKSPRKSSHGLNLDQHHSKNRIAKSDTSRCTGRARKQELFDRSGNNRAARATGSTRSKSKKMDFGQQTPCHSSTQTPVVIRLDDRGRLWMSQDALSHFRNLGADDSRLLFAPLDYKSRRYHGNRNSSSRIQATNDSDHMIRDVTSVDTQTEIRYAGGGEAPVDEPSAKVKEMSAKTRSRVKQDAKGKGKTGEDKMIDKDRGKDESVQRNDADADAKKEKESPPVDESRKHLLLMMLREMKVLRRHADRKNDTDRDKDKEAACGATHRDKEASDGVTHRDKKTARSDRDLRRSGRTSKRKDLINRIISWKEKVENPEFDRGGSGTRTSKGQRDSGAHRPLNASHPHLHSSYDL